MEIGKEIYNNLSKYRPLRDDFIHFFEKLLKSETEFDIEILIKFIEKLPLYERPTEHKSSWYEYEYDNFRIIIHELFLYLITISLKTEKYAFVEALLYADYFFQDQYEDNREPQEFTSLYHFVETMDVYYKQTFSKNFYSTMADFIIARIPDGYSKDIIVEADLLCHYIATMNEERWFPMMYVYKTRGYFALFDRLVSRRHFEKVKTLFGVDTVKEFQDKLIMMQNNDKGKNMGGMRYNNCWESVRPIYTMINIDSIGTSR